MIDSNKKYPKIITEFLEIQKKYSDAIIIYQVGGFYELWTVDGVGYAVEASQILDLVLTRRNKSLGEESPQMCGFPVHSSDLYLKRLVSAGWTVVVVSQVVNGKKSDQNKNVERAITQILSPGTIIENLANNKSNYFASVYFDEDSAGVALIDVSTGEVIITELPISDLKDFLEIKNPSEILIIGDMGNFVINKKEHQLIHNVTDSLNRLSSCGQIFSNIYNIPNPTSNPSASLISLGIEMLRLGSLALGNLLNYLTDYNLLLLKKVGVPTVYSFNEHLMLPNNAFISLDLFKNMSGSEETKDTFVGVLDRCKTAMGQRKLRSMIEGPLVDLDQINKRLDKVESFIKRNDYLPELKEIYDFSRLSRRMAISRLMPHEIVNFYKSLETSANVFKKEGPQESLSAVEDVCNFINSTINIKEADGLSELTLCFFRDGSNSELTELHGKWKKEEEKLYRMKDRYEEDLGAKGKLRINQNKESFTLTGPKSLAIEAKAQNIAIMVRASEVQIIEEDWIKFSKICLQDQHTFLFKAQKFWEKFQIELINRYGDKIIKISDQIAELDCISNFAQISNDRHYTRPKFVDKETSYLNLVDMRHPVIELSSRLTEGFISNTVNLGEDKKTLIIYGANSAGKSTILKALALNIIMAQIGCYIAASEGSELTIFDAILTRMASFDSITEGLSTFTQEMFELQSALKYKEKKSIFLFDEIGRGTSVDDGEAIAYGTLVYLDSESNKSITLFATHYHSLVEKIENLKSIEIKHVSCETHSDGSLIFSRKLQKGPGTGSYGILVAQSCGIPPELIRIATRYNETYSKLKKSRYNSALEGSLCELCHTSKFQETHHIFEQKQGTVTKFKVDGQIKDINDKSNLVLLCASCHEMVTRGEITIVRKFKTSGNNYFLEIKKSLQ